MELPKDSPLNEAFEKEKWKRDEKENHVPSNKGKYAGIISIDGLEIPYYDEKLFTKKNVKPLIFHLYEYAITDTEEWGSLNKVFLLDGRYPVRIKQGLFDTLLPLMFFQELSKIMEYGLHREYVQKEDNLSFARGKINMKSQMTNEIRKNTLIACTYWDLTTNNFFNQAILFASCALIKQSKTPYEIKPKLASLVSDIRSEFVEDAFIRPHDFLIQRNVPKRYKNIMMLAKAVIRREYHSIEIKENDIELPSFMIDLATLWESFLRSVIRKIFYTEWRIDKIQEKSKILDRNYIVPDIIMKLENEEKHEMIIIDAKYKKEKPSSGDLYQMCAYLGSNQKKGKIGGVLLYFDLKEKNDIYFYPETRENENNKILIHIDFFSDCFEGEIFEEQVGRVKDKIEKAIKCVLGSFKMNNDV